MFVNSCLVLSIVILLFFLHSAIHLELSLAWISIIGAMALLLISGIRDIEEVLGIFKKFRYFLRIFFRKSRIWNIDVLCCFICINERIRRLKHVIFMSRDLIIYF